MLHNSNLISYATCCVVLCSICTLGPHKTAGKATINNTCESDNCMEETISTDGTYLGCTIKRQKGWEEFKKKNNIVDIGDGIVESGGAVPVISRVSLYFLEYNRNLRVAALNISFRVPAKCHDEVTKAVLLTFTSVKDNDYKDKYYADNPRYRLFEFSTPSSVIPEQQRWLQYPCIYGLYERSDSALVYVLSLTSFSTKDALPNTLEHQITTYTKKRKNDFWISTLVTSVVPNTINVRVVFEPLPTKWVTDRTTYSLDLTDANHNKLIASSKVPHKSEKYEYIFNNTREGSFVVKLNVESHNFPGEIQESISYRFEVYSQNTQRHSIKKQHEHIPTWLPSKAAQRTESQSDTSTRHERFDTMLFASVGCIVGLFLVVMLTVCFFKYKKRLTGGNNSSSGIVDSETTLNNTNNTEINVGNGLTRNEHNLKNAQQTGTQTLFPNENPYHCLLDSDAHQNHTNKYYTGKCPIHGKTYCCRKQVESQNIISESNDEEMNEINIEMIITNFGDLD